MLTKDMRRRVFDRLLADRRDDFERIAGCCSCRLNSVRVCPWSAFGLGIPRNAILV